MHIFRTDFDFMWLNQKYYNVGPIFFKIMVDNLFLMFVTKKITIIVPKKIYY